MVSIKDRKILRQMFSHYDYVMTTAQLSKEKLYYRDIQRMLKAGLIEKVKRGYYHWTMGSGKGDVVIISRLFPDGILYMETALFYYGYSDRNPAEWNIAIDKNASRQRTRIDYPSIKAYRLEPALLSIGVTRGEINFTDVRIYDRDRTICDVLRNMNKMDKEIFNKAIQGYVNDPQKNVPNLIEYWFNPLVWLAFKLFVTDMEMSCDESVIRNSKEDIRKEYSRSLLELSIEKSTLGIPMAFAEGNPKERIKNVMKSNTKKIIGFAGLGAVILIVVIAICLIPNRPQYATAKQTITEINAIATPSATHAEIKTADGNKTITDSAYFNELLTFVEGIEINTKEVKRGSWIDSEENNKITFYRADNSMDSIISFTSDYSKIWIETSATISFTYSVKDPAEVQKGLAAFLGNNS